MRSVFIFLILVTILAAIFKLSQVATRWHYVVPSEPGKLLYIETFDDPTDEWELAEGRLTSEIVDGTLHLGVDIEGQGVYSTANPYFRNFDLQVDTQAVDGPDNNTYGVVFRQLDTRNYYVFFISSNGFYYVGRVKDNTTKVLHNWHYSELIRPGMGVSNALRVVGHEDRFRFYINGEAVELCIPDNPDGESTPLATGECRDGTWQTTLVDDGIPYGRLGTGAQVGVFEPTGVVVEFDNVIVYGSEPIE